MIAYLRRFLALILSLFSWLPGLFGGTDTRAWRETAVTPVVNDIRGDSALSDSVLLASALSNAAQCVYADAERTAYRMENRDMTLTHTLSRFSGGATLTDPDGNAYIRDSFDAWCRDAGGDVWYASDSAEKGRANTIRFGKYYWDAHVRDYDLKPKAFKVDKEFHVWSDRLYLQYSLFADEPTTELDSFGAEIRIPRRSVAGLRVRDAAGDHDGLSFDPETVEFAAFEIKDAGVVGFIPPVTGETASLTVKAEKRDYVVTLTASYVPGTGINQFDETGGYDLNRVTCGCRVYTDGTHDFDGVASAAAIERAPIEITADSGEPVVWNGLRGCYEIRLPGTWFQYAYDNPETRFPVGLHIPGTDDRDVYVCATTEAGGLEACVILDETGTLAPIDVQVCKNFSGDIVEHYYSVGDHSYGDAFFPVAVRTGKDLDLTAIHLYQNWGGVPLKQLSSIEFHTAYYHLSTGTTESNCISPYYADGNDSGFLLPDFRGRSGVMWQGQPQFNAVGKPCFLIDRSYPAEKCAEYEGSRINSVGPTHADVQMRFLSGDGSYRYTVRHVEFPQTDENRTYFTVDVEFLKTKSYANFRGQMDLFFQTGRFLMYKSVVYSGPDGQEVTDPFEYGLIRHYHRLGGEYPWYSLTTIDKSEEEILNDTFGANAAAIIRGSRIVRGGKEADIPFTVRTFSYNDFTDSALTLDLGAITFKKGDSIHLDLVLLPWGTGLETDCENVRRVLADSAVDRLRVTAAKGKAGDDFVIPTVRAEDNEAVFTVSGGGGNSVVKIGGFTRFGRLVVEEETGGAWTAVDLASDAGYDGYGVQYDPDGTYCYSFVYEADGAPRTFRARIA